MKDIIGISIKEALKLDKLKEVKLLAGAGGIKRHIKKINIMEVPDILDWVEDGELLLTTLYSIKDDQKALKELIPGLADKKLAGLGVKPERYVKKIPDFMIEQANRFNFPLLEIPYNLSFSELINPILSEILNLQNKFLEKTLNVHEKLTDVVSRGLGKLAIELVTMINNPVMLLDSSYNILASEIPEKISDKLSIEILYSKIKKESFMEKKGFQYVESTIKINSKEYKQVKLPVITSNNLLGYLYTWEISSKINRLDMATLKWASTIAALDIINKRAISEVERKYRNELLYDVVKGKIREKETVIKRGNLMGWDFTKEYRVILIDLKKIINKYMKKKRTLNQNILKTVIDSIKLLERTDIIYGDLGAYIIILYPGYEDQYKSCKENITNYVNSVLSIFDKEERSMIYVGVGNYYSDIMDINQSYYQAKRAINVAYTMRNNKIYFFDELGFYQLLYKVNKGDFDLFLKNTLGPLIKYDKKHNTELIKTLEEYFKESGNLANIAKNLYIHYNTVLYRIQRIEKITGMNLNNSDERLNLEVALKLLNLNGGSKGGII